MAARNLKKELARLIAEHGLESVWREFKSARSHARQKAKSKSGRRRDWSFNDLALWAVVEFRRKNSVAPRSAIPNLHKDIAAVFAKGIIAQKTIYTKLSIAELRRSNEPAAKSESDLMLQGLIDRQDQLRQFEFCVVPALLKPGRRAGEFRGPTLDTTKFRKPVLWFRTETPTHSWVAYAIAVRRK